MANKPKDVKDIPVSIDEDVKLNVIACSNIIQFDESAKKYRKSLKVTNSAQIEHSSKDLTEGMSIKAHDNDEIAIRKLIEFKNNRNNIVSFADKTGFEKAE